MKWINKLEAKWDEYTENTTIHGLKYLADKRRLFSEKVYWTVIFAISILYLGGFAQNVFKKFNDRSAILVEDKLPTPIHEIPFPAVTVCPVIKIKTKFFPDEDVLKWLQGYESENKIMDLAYILCNQRLLHDWKSNNVQTGKPYLNTSHIDLLHDISPNIDETLMNVKFASKTELEFGQVGGYPFSYILTNEGICFTFNLPSEIMSDNPSLQTDYKYHNIQNESVSWDNEIGYYGYPRFPRTVWAAGSTSGLYLTMASNTSDLNTICQPSQIGYKILLHSPEEYPTTLEKFISITHNTFSQIRITPKITTTSIDAWKLKPQARQCFFNDERKLKYFTYYNRINCKLECLANYTQQQYGCVHFSLPRNASQPICGRNITISQMYDTEEVMESYFDFKKEVAKSYNKSEMDTLFDDPFEFAIFSNLKCNCLPSCNSVDYEYSIETETIDVNKLGKKYFPGEELEVSAGVVIDIYFGATKVTGATRKQFYTLDDLISNLGGLMGLFMGASILSIFETIYFLFVR